MILARWLAPIFRNRWIKTLFGVVLLAVLIWVFGPAIGLGQMHPLDSEIARIIAIAALLVLWLVINLLHVISEHKKDSALAGAVTNTEPDAAERASAEEVALLTDRLREALQTLRKTNLGGKRRGRLYQLPWFMFVGPPGAGKTTALRNCGLSFPLADKDGGAAVRGVGGTRNCDWWFTDQAVLIDTAGRYTTQDSDQAVDAAAWLGFLRLLKKYRGRQPLNGVIVAIALSDLAQLGEAERQAHARAVRRRVRELADVLGVRIPVYVLFTKADLLSGFTEFFDTFGREEREQVWGATFALDTGSDDDGAVAAFDSEFTALVARLNTRMLERLQQETDVQRRRLIYGFPQQVASMQAVAGEFLRDAFRPSRLEARPLLRGIYLTSGTQDGTPVDRLLSTMSSQFGLPRQAVAALPRQGRSYFLARLVREVVFGEAALVSKDARLERRTRWIYRGAYAGAVLFLVAITALWTTSYIGNGAMIEDAHAKSIVYTGQLAEVEKLGPADISLTAILPPLETLRTMRGGYDDQDKSPPLTLTFGLWQGEKITSAAVDAYYRALDGLLMPRLLARLEAQMQANLGKPEFLYPALKVYLILGRQGPMDRDLVMQWMESDFVASFPGEDNVAVANALIAHLEARLKRPLTAMDLNGPLIAEVRSILNRQPLAEYSYNRIIHASRVQSLPAWTVAQNAGPGAARVFILRSGKDLDHGVPGVFTWQGYHAALLPLLPTVTQDVAEDEWVLGRSGATGVRQTLEEAARLRRDVLGLYLDDYTRHWDEMIADITVKPFGSTAEALDQLSLMSAPASPFRDLMQSIDQQTQLSRPAATDAAESKLESKAGKVGQRFMGLAQMQARMGLSFQQNEIATMLSDVAGGSSGTAGGKPVDPASRVDDHFKWLHNFVAVGDSGTSPMEQAIANIGKLYQAFNQTAGAPNEGALLLANMTTTGGTAAAASQLEALSRDMPPPVAKMLQTVAHSGSSITTTGASQEIQQAWSNRVLPLCLAAFQRYPFLPDSKADVPPDDFAKLLGPGGLMEQFFDQYLKSFVDQTSEPWRWQSTDKTPLALSPDSAAAFERAAQIRDALFPNGSAVQVKFQLVPVKLRLPVAQATVEIAGQPPLTYNNGPPEAMQFQWPGANGNTLSRLTLTPADGGPSTVYQFDDPWALLRLIDAGRLVPSGEPEKFEMMFTSPAGGAAVFDLNASSVRNPFNGALRSFRCPAKL